MQHYISEAHTLDGQLYTKHLELAAALAYSSTLEMEAIRSSSVMFFLNYISLQYRKSNSSYISIEFAKLFQPKYEKVKPVRGLFEAQK
jgi:hypothetical protein